MTARPLTITLRTSDGNDVQLLAGEAASWPEQAEFSWCGKDEDGKPVLHRLKGALRWAGSIAGVVACEVYWEDTEVSTNEEHVSELSDENQRAVYEAGIDFEQAVTKALQDEQAMRPFADFEQSRALAREVIEAAWMRFPEHDRCAMGGPRELDALSDPTERQTPCRMLRQHVRRALADAEKAATARAAAAYEAAGGVYETEDKPGSERTNLRSVPDDTLLRAALELQTGEDLSAVPIEVLRTRLPLP